MTAVLDDLRRELRSTARSFLAASLPARATVTAPHPAAFDPGWWRAAAELGWTSLVVPAHLGGSAPEGGGVLEAALIAQELGASLASGPFVPVTVAAFALASSPTSQAAGLLEVLMAGTSLVLWSHPQPGIDRGTNGDAHRSFIARRVEGGWLVDGRASELEDVGACSHVLVTATVESPATRAAVVQLAVETRSDGVIVQPQDSLDVSRRWGTIFLRSTFVPDSAVICEPAHAGAFDRQLDLAVTLQCADTVGIDEHVLRSTLDYAMDRWAFGRPIASFQAIKHRCADMKLWTESSAAMATNAAERVQADDPAASLECAAAKVYVSERSLALVQDCIQIHGGIGVTWEHEIHLYLRRAMANWALFGTPSTVRRRLAEQLSRSTVERGAA